MMKHMNTTTPIMTVETYDYNMFGFVALNLGFDMPNYDEKHLEKCKHKRLRC